MDCSLCGCTSKTNKTPRAPHWPLKIVPFEVPWLDMDLCFSFAVKSFSRCAQSRARGWTRSAAGPGPSRGASGTALHRGGRGAAEPPRAVGFSSDTHLGRVCVAPDRARLGKRAGRLGFVTALLGPGERRGAHRAPGSTGLAVEHLGTGPAAVAPRNAVPAWGALLWLGLSGLGSCGREDVAFSTLEQRPHWRFSAGVLSGPTVALAGPRGLWAMLAKLPSYLPPRCFNWQHCPCHFYSQDLKPASWLIWLPWGQSPTLGPPHPDRACSQFGEEQSKLLTAPH